MSKDFVSRSPCIQCRINGIEFDENSLFCKKCKYFILVSVLEKILFQKTKCDYCSQTPYGDNACTWCNFQLDIDKLLSEYRLEEDLTDFSNVDVDNFSQNEPVKSFSEDEWEWLDIDAWLDEEDYDDEWED